MSKGYCSCYDDGYDDGWEEGRREVETLDIHCGSCHHWYPKRNACFYYPHAKRWESCKKWEKLVIDGGQSLWTIGYAEYSE